MQKETNNLLLKKILIFYFITLITTLNPYMKENLSFPEMYKNTSIAISVNKSTKDFYKIKSKSILTNQIWLNSNSNYSITNSFIINILKFENENQILKMELKYKNNQLIKFELIMEEDKNYITISSCEIIQRLISKNESKSDCKNELGGKNTLKYLINSYKILTPNYEIINNELNKSPLYILNFIYQ